MQSPGLSVAYVHGTLATCGNSTKSTLLGSIPENDDPEYSFWKKKNQKVKGYQGWLKVNLKGTVYVRKWTKA